MADTKEQYINVCFLGHVDSGKSTTIGHLCFKLGAIDKRTVEKLEEAARDHGKGSFGFAFYCDNNKAERESGITIQVSMKVVKTAKHTVNILDCPGHRGFLKNMITGTAQADVAVIIVPAAQGEFERAITETGTLYEHIILAHTLGVSKAIVAVNKLDTLPSPAEAEKRFQEITENIKAKMKKMYDMKNTPIVPISGFKGIGLTRDSDKFEWFKGWKPEDKPDAEPIRSLEEAIDFYPLPKRLIEAPLRFPLTSIFDIKGIGKVYTGRVEYGTCTQNMKVLISPGNIKAEVKTLEIHKKARKSVEAGENCGITLKVSSDDVNKIKQGSVLSEQARSPCADAYAAHCTVIFLSVKSSAGEKKEAFIKAGYAPMMDISTTHVNVVFAKLCDIGTKKGKEYIVTEESPSRITIAPRVCARVVLVPTKSTVMEPFATAQCLGRFALREQSRTIAVGIINKIFHTKDEFESACPEFVKDFGRKGALATKKK
ncbi:elongation factor 1-alpha [Nematocida homosporus]|uniref:elongation factor 1-alpha n=1 Tax=Nematocida homosporus TaxID=1912981 RepID=UPI0022209CFD|nr:elongation factor 1-alpha [Nematocida homosporus]KAI5184297.1 elongation factor 1-alpha [Nematocida homosporus]